MYKPLVMKPKHKKELRINEVRRIYAKLESLRNRMGKLGYVKLEKPIRHGWFKEILITDKIKRYKKSKHIVEVFNKLEKAYWGRTKEDAAHKYHYATSKYLIHKEIPTLGKNEYKQLSDEAKKLCTPFHYSTPKRKRKTRYYINIPKGAYKIKFTRAYITHRRRIEPNLEKQYAYLCKKLYQNGFYEAERKLYSWVNDWEKEKKWFKNIQRKRDKRITKHYLNQFKNIHLEDVTKYKASWEKN